MKRTTFSPWAFVVSSMLISVFCFAGLPIGAVLRRSAGRGPSGIDTTIDEIRKIEMQVKESFITGDSVLFLKCYTSDACVLAPNAPTLCGQPGISRFFNGVRQAGIRDATLNSLGLFGETSEYVTQQGTFENFDAGQRSLIKGKILIIWKKTDQGWRIFRQMLNFDSPMTQPSTR